MSNEQLINTFRVPCYLFENNDFIALKQIAKVVLFYLIECFEKNNYQPFHCTTEKISKATGMVKGTVSKAKKLLIKMGFIKIIRKGVPRYAYESRQRTPNYFDLSLLFEPKIG